MIYKSVRCRQCRFMIDVIETDEGLDVKCLEEFDYPETMMSPCSMFDGSSDPLGDVLPRPLIERVMGDQGMGEGEGDELNKDEIPDEFVELFDELHIILTDQEIPGAKRIYLSDLFKLLGWTKQKIELFIYWLDENGKPVKVGQRTFNFAPATDDGSEDRRYRKWGNKYRSIRIDDADTDAAVQ